MGSGASVYNSNGLETIDCNDIPYEEVTRRLTDGSICAIDVRERDEVESTGLVSGAQNVPLGELDSAFRLGSGEFYRRYGFPKPMKDNCQICVYCLAGVRAVKAVVALHQLGYRNVMRYPGGWQEWSMRHLRPTTKRTSHRVKSVGYPQATQDYYIPAQKQSHCQAQELQCRQPQEYFCQPVQQQPCRQIKKPIPQGYCCPALQQERQQQHPQQQQEPQCQEYCQISPEECCQNAGPPCTANPPRGQMQVRTYTCRPRRRCQSFPQDQCGQQLPLQQQAQQQAQQQRRACDMPQDCEQLHPQGECQSKQACRMRTYDTYYYY